MKLVNHHAGCCGYLPMRPDGQEWPHVLGLPGGASVHADSAAEILGEIIEGYEALEPAARSQARQDHARSAAVAHQELRIAQAVADGVVRADDPDDAALMGLLRAAAGRTVRLARAPGGDETPGAGTPEADARWEGAIRLVCLTTSYAPHGDAPRPHGRVDWIDPTDEERYLISLRRVGALDYWCAAAQDG